MNKFLKELARLWWVEVGTELNNPISEKSIIGLRKVLKEEYDFDSEVIEYIIESAVKTPTNFHLGGDRTSGIVVGKNDTAVSAHLNSDEEESVDENEEEKENDEKDDKQSEKGTPSGDDKEQAIKDLEQSALTAKEKEELKEYSASEFEELLFEAKGDTAATTFFHEIISGIAAVKGVSAGDFQTGADVKKYFDDNTIQCVDAGLSTFSIRQMKQVRFLDSEVIPNPKIVSDAIKSGNAIKSIVGKYSKVYWAGPTNDGSDFGAADIILSKGSAKDGVGVSLKYGKGQLKNLTANQFFQAVIGKSDTNFMHTIYDLNNDGFNKMTSYFAELMDKKIKELTNDRKTLSAWKKMYSGVKNWDGYQKRKIDKKSAELFAQMHEKIDVKKCKNVQYLGRKLAEIGLDGWKEAKQQYFDIFFGEFIKQYEDIMVSNLTGLFKRQLSVTKKDLWYSASGGSDLKLIPGSENFDKIAPSLDITQSHKSTGSGYMFILTVVKDKKELGNIKVTIRWKKGQMAGYPDTTSASKWNIDNKEWAKIFSGK
jgi:hypothetical protein